MSARYIVAISKVCCVRKLVVRRYIDSSTLASIDLGFT
jgi:hypothetical protein